MNDIALAPAGHNGPAPSEVRKLFASARESLGAHSRHSKNAVEQLHSFLIYVMETYESAQQNADEVDQELTKAHAPRGRSGDWFRPLVKAAFDEADRKREKTNISKYVSVLSYAERRRIPSAELGEYLAKTPISEIARLEAEARGADKGNPASEQPDPAFEALIEKRRQPIKLTGVILADDGKRFKVLVVEDTPDQGLWLVAQATSDISGIRRHFPELPKRGGRRAVANQQGQPQT
jgi:hypothetical protein